MLITLITFCVSLTFDGAFAFLLPEEMKKDQNSNRRKKCEPEQIFKSFPEKNSKQIMTTYIRV